VSTSGEVLGRFLELSLLAPDILQSYQFYEQLGFASAPTGDVWPHRYAVMTDGRIAIGLHQQAATPRFLTYVQPELRTRLARIEALGIEPEHLQLADDRFNELWFRDPDGYGVRLLEARTFSSPGGLRLSACGWFEELALPVRDGAATQRFWETVGFVGVGEESAPYPHLALTSDGLDLGLYAGGTLEKATLRFSVRDLAAARARLEAAGLAVDTARKPAQGFELAAPEGTRILVTLDESDATGTYTARE
jgi:hypothetical protein